VRQEAS